MLTATLEGYVFSPGDIVYTSGRTPCFYRVTKRTKCFVTIQRIQSDMVIDSDGYGQNGYDRPINIDHDYHKPVRVKILSDANHPGEYGKIDGKWYNYLYPYNGNPVEFYCD